MFDFRTKSLTALVCLLVAIQLLLQPAAGLLHSGCRDHSCVVGLHAADDCNVQHSLWRSAINAWHWLTHSGCCHHVHSTPAVAATPAKSNHVTSHRSSGNCAYCQRKKAAENSSQPSNRETDHPSNDTPVPAHDAHQCVICQVVFAARLNAVAVQLPTLTEVVPLAVREAVPVVEIAPRFQRSPRGPPAA
ncbi:MAG: hypothetical protein R3C59_13940 [Planctomycetaceae bacterium]